MQSVRDYKKGRVEMTISTKVDLFDIAQRLSVIACECDDNVETQMHVDILHTIAQHIAGDRVNELYPPEDFMPTNAEGFAVMPADTIEQLRVLAEEKDEG